jgi:DsbC/DsbD-like thiol-disulfide interchange protein
MRGNNAISPQQSDPMKHLAVVAVAFGMLHSGTTPAAALHSVDSASTLSVRVEVSPERIHPGTDCHVRFMITIRNGWHINSPAPSDENLTGTSIEIARIPGIDSTILHYPEPVERRLDFADAPLQVYDEAVTIPARLYLAANLEPGTYTLPVVITYQACNNVVCLAPATIHMTIPLRVVPVDSSGSRNHRKTPGGGKK